MIFDGLIQWHRNWSLAGAIEKGDLTWMDQVLSKGVDLNRFSASLAEETYDIGTHSRDVKSVLEWALEHHLSADGFELLTKAGAPMDESVVQRLDIQANSPEIYPDAAAILAVLQAAQLDAGGIAPSDNGPTPRRARL